MCWFLVFAVSSSRNQDHPFSYWNPAKLMYQCWGLSVSRSNEQIKFKLSTRRKRSCTKQISFGVGGQQPARDCSCIRSSPMSVCETTETNICCSSAPAWPPAGTTHALHTLPCFSSQLCESWISQPCRPPPFLRRAGALAWRYLNRESPRGRTLLQCHLQWISTLSETWQGVGATIIFICTKLEAELPDQLHSVFEGGETYRT